MAKLEWDKEGQRFYETGVRNCVLYTKDSSGKYANGVAWNGITQISEKPTGAETTPLYADDTKYLNLLSAESLEATIEAYMYPTAFEACDGTAEIETGVTIGQQDRKTFGLCYRTTVGNDEEGNGKGYKLHLIYGCVASPAEKGYSTINDSPEAITFSWEVKTTPISMGGELKPTASVIIDSTKLADTTNLKKLEDVLYGTASSEPWMPTPSEVAAIIKDGTVPTRANG